MRPKKQATTGESDLFRARLDQIINMKHELVLPPNGSPAATSSAPMSTRDTAATTPQTHTAFSSPDRSAACSAAAQAHLRAVRRIIRDIRRNPRLVEDSLVPNPGRDNPRLLRPTRAETSFLTGD
jgi:IS5 family transposase